MKEPFFVRVMPVKAGIQGGQTEPPLWTPRFRGG